MKLPDIKAMIDAGGVPYTSVRDEIQSGDLLFLHDEFVPSWYGVQIGAVQLFTGPFAHVGLFDRIGLGGVERLVVYESVVPKVRGVLVSATAQDSGGFFWMKMQQPIAAAEREAAWREMGVNEYDKVGAVLAGLNMLPPDEDANPRRWCSKAVTLWRRFSGVEFSNHYVPSIMAEEALDMGGQLQYVRMRP